MIFYRPYYSYSYGGDIYDECLGEKQNPQLVVDINDVHYTYGDILMMSQLGVAEFSAKNGLPRISLQQLDFHFVSCTAA